MKSPAHSRIRGWLLGLSVAVNLWFWWQGSTTSISSPGSNESLDPSKAHLAETSAGSIHKALSTDPIREAWEAVALGDFVRMNDQLRAAGCPIKTVQEAVAKGMAEKAQAEAEEMERGLSGLRSETLQKLRTIDLGLNLQAVDRFADAELDFVKTLIEAKRRSVATPDDEAESSKQFERQLFSLCEEHFGAQGAAVFAKLTGGTPSKP